MSQCPQQGVPLAATLLEFHSGRYNHGDGRSDGVYPPMSLQAPGLVVAEVLSVDPHPKADRLRVCTLDAGGSSPVKVVTNAPNVEEGMKVVFAVSASAGGS